MKARSVTKETVMDNGVLERNFPKFSIGDTIQVSQTFKEGDKERSQLFEGDVIAMHNNGVSTTFTVRRIGANGVGVEKIFPFFSPTVASVKLIKSGRVRRAKLYYIRERLGKAARIPEKVQSKAQTSNATKAA